MRKCRSWEVDHGPHQVVIALDTPVRRAKGTEGLLRLTPDAPAASEPHRRPALLPSPERAEPDRPPVIPATAGIQRGAVRTGRRGRPPLLERVRPNEPVPRPPVSAFRLDLSLVTEEALKPGHPRPFKIGRHLLEERDHLEGQSLLRLGIVAPDAHFVAVFTAHASEAA